MIVEFFVHGVPSTKGSARAFVVGGRAVITNDAGAKAKAWASLVKDAAVSAMAGSPPFEGPVHVTLIFFLPRPKSHYLPVNPRRPSPVLRSDAPRYVICPPDGDKLERCTWDALTHIVFRDDAQVAGWEGRKLYDGRVGCLIRIARLS